MECLHALLDRGPRFETAQLTVRVAGEATVRAWLSGRRKRLEAGQCVDVWDGSFHWHNSATYACRVRATDGDQGTGVWTTGRQTLDLMLDPAAIRRTHDLTALASGRVAGRAALRARAVPRATALETAYVAEAQEVTPGRPIPSGDTEEVVIPVDAVAPLMFADEGLLAVDAEHGVLLALQTRYGDDVRDATLVEEAVFDGTIPDERFVYVPPPGLEVTLFD